MQPLIRQLERVRNRARAMLLIIRAAHWLTAVIAVALAAGLVDYFLRLPGWLRMSFLIVGIGVAAVTAVVRIGRACRARPALTSLALRLERIYPHTGGQLASAVAFATESHHANSPISAQLARQATDSAQHMLASREVNRLLDPRRAILSVLGLLAAVVVLAGIASAAPGSFAIGFQRWTQPLGDARWPNRFAVESLTNQEVAPDNAPLPVAARVTKGDHEKLRTTAVYRFLRDGQPLGDWQRALMTRQNDLAEHGGTYQRLIEPAGGADEVLLYFEAGDDVTDLQAIQLIQPPTLVQAMADVTPPDYATDFLPPQRHDLLTPPRPVVTIDALAGSRVTLRLAVVGSFDAVGSEATLAELRQWMGQNLMGLFADLNESQITAMDLAHTVSKPEGGPTEVTLSWTLREPGQFRFHFADAFGSRYEDQRLFRFEARVDRAPRATILEPAGDESVLPTAVVPLTAEAQDDVAVSDVALLARHGEADPLNLAADDTDQPRATLRHELDLGPLKLEPGDELAVVARVQDNYLLDGERHDPVESSPRRLVIISPEELVRQVRTELAEVRQRAVRARESQHRLLESPANADTAQQQRDLAERIEGMRRSVAELQQRTERNRLADEQIDDTLSDAKQMMGQAGETARQAGDALSRAAQKSADDPQAAQQNAQARQGQEATQQKLDDLIQLLDQGRDAYELKQRLVKIQKDQEALVNETRKTLPRTLGQTEDQLSDQDRQALRQLEQEQQNVAQQARELMDRMRSTAAALDRQSENTEDEATAEALRQAASTATQQMLDQKMSEAAKQVGRNQLSQAQTAQGQAQETIRQMLEQIGRTDDLRQEILKRKLMQLVDSIRKLRDTQQAQLERLQAAADLTDLDAPLLTLRRNTLAVADLARQTDPKTAPVGDLLEAAAAAQGTAVERLRGSNVVKADVEAAEEQSLTKLEEALKLAEELSAEAQDNANDEKKQQLIAAYKKALTEQTVIIDETTKLTDIKPNDRDRRWRGSSMQVGERQKTLRTELGELQKQLDDTIVYRSVHEQMDAWAHNAAGSLSKAQPGAATLFQQRMIAGSIEALIEALQPNQPDEQFATSQGGGSGGGSGGPQPLIPPAAEVKLLRARQIQVHEATRQISEAGDGLDTATRQELVDQLFEQQDGLATTATKLVETLKQQQNQAGGGLQPLQPNQPGEPEQDAEPAPEQPKQPDAEATDPTETPEGDQ